jgi:hypothetical protein
MQMKNVPVQAAWEAAAGRGPAPQPYIGDEYDHDAN